MRAMALMLLLGTAPQAKSLKEGSRAEVRADFEMICNAVQRSGAAGEKDMSQKAQKIADYLLSHIATKQAMSFMQSMGGMLPEEKAPALKKKARESGYSGACPFADEK
jgi:predicted YcjX-like family ATPase